ncbi:MAG: hypothetical protein ACK6D3_19115 [Planctomycetaceae bacterium]
MNARWPMVGLGVLLWTGCSGSQPTPQPKAERTGIFGKTTQEIGQFDPQAAQQVSDQKIRASDPVTAPLTAYGPMAEKVSILAVEQAINLFQATEGRYPKDHAEFMEKIIRANNMRLPVLPNKGEYRYDEQSHALVVVYPAGQEGAGTGTKTP